MKIWKILIIISTKMKKLSNLIVDKISLVTKDKKPAVPKASTGFFSVFKIKKEKSLTPEQVVRIQKLKDFYTKK